MRRYRDRGVPVLSVVVPVHDGAEFLPACLDALLQQPGDVQVVVVDDGSTDGSRDVAVGYARRHGNVTVVSQPHRGVGAARNRGVKRATGQYLAFCDVDDVPPRRGYRAMVRALEESGSDLAVGAVALKDRGRFVQPEWSRRSNPTRRLGAAPSEVPEVLGNLVVGTRVFRRESWDRSGLRFERDDEGSDARLMVTSLLRAGTVDVLPRVVYRWTRHRGALHQKDLFDPVRVAARVRALGFAGEPLTEAPEALRLSYFAGILHTTVPDLVKAAVTRDDGCWQALHRELPALLDMIPPSTLEQVPVSDRITAWLCSRDERTATEDFLEYDLDNENGFPFDLHHGRPRIALPFIDVLASAPPELTLVADADMRFRTRLTRLRWDADGVLRLQGAAFLEYVDDRCGPPRIELVLRHARTGRTVTVPTRPCPEVHVERWADRAHEDHSGAGFAADIDVDALDLTEPGAYRVHVRLRHGGFRRTGRFRSRNAVGSPGLLEPRLVGGLSHRPAWGEHVGLSLRVSARAARPVPAPSGVVVHAVSGRGSRLVVEGTSDRDVRIALEGPRVRTPPVETVRAGEAFTAEISLLHDEWGAGQTSLPTDVYELVAHTASGAEPVACALELWRELPRPFDTAEWNIGPRVPGGRGGLAVRLQPREWVESRPPFLRQALRDRVYVEARQQPLLDAVLFETFAGRATGDNPGAICAEFARRETGLDLVFSQTERTMVTPPGSRTVIRASAEWYEMLGRARYVVTNAGLPAFFRKRPGQIYLQTWHGHPFKRVGHDTVQPYFGGWYHRRKLDVAKAQWAFLLSQSPECTVHLTGAFHYQGPVLEVGYPRNDVLNSADAAAIRSRVRAYFGIPETATVVLYAPTWRDNQRVGNVWDKVFHLDPLQVVAAMDDAYVVVRGHYNSMAAAEEPSPSERVLDLTRYPDVADLYLAADVLVTDYSSVFFDFSLTDKPMVFLAPDLDSYRDQHRGFYFDYEETVPGPICRTTAEVIAVLNGPDEHQETRARFRERFNPYDDGAAAVRVVDRLLAVRDAEA